MKRLFCAFLLLAFAIPAFAQRFVDEVPTLAALKTRNVFNLNRSVFVREAGVGGSFTITNSAILVDEVFRVASTHNAAWSYDRQFSGPIDLRWGGAVGDGSAGDNTKIQNVINAAASRGYAALLSNLTGTGSTNQFQLSIIPTLKANQNYLQIGTINGLRVVTDASSNFLFSSFGQHVFDRGLLVGTNTRVNLGGLSTETTNGLFLATVFNKAAGDPTRAYMLTQVNKDATNMNEVASAQIFVNSTNAYFLITALDTNAVSTMVQLSSSTNAAGVLITKGGVTNKNAYLGIGPSAITSLFTGPQLIINGTNSMYWNDTAAQMALGRTTSNGLHILSLTDGSGAADIARFYGSAIDYPNTGLHVSANGEIGFSISSPWVLRLDPYASVVVGDGNTNTTRATNFLYIPTLFGVPTGTPTNYTGTAPMAWDAANGNLYVNRSNSWILVGGLSGSWNLNFSDQFDQTLNTNISLAIGLRTTNQVLEGNVIAPSISLGSKTGTFDIDAGASLELNFLLTGNATISLTNFNDYHPLSVVITNNGNFAITWADTMYWMPNGSATQVTNDWGVGIINRFTFWRSGGRIMASDKEGLATLGGGGSSGGNPSASVGLAAINGVSSLFLRSDGAPPLSQSIAPTWSNLHIWLGDGSNLIDLRSTSAAASGSNLRIPFRFLDTDLAYYEAAGINVVRPSAWDGTGASRDAALGLDVMMNGTSTRLLQLYSSAVSGTPIAWFPALSTDLVYGNLSVLGTTATRGFLYLTTCAGTPTGVPGLAAAGAVPVVFDTTGNKLWAYDGGWIDLTGAAGITTPVSIANGGTGTNTMGTTIGNVPFLSSNTNLITVDNGNFVYDASSRVLEVLHPTTTAQPHFWALNVDTGISLQTWADRIFVSGNADLTLEVFNSARSIMFTNNQVRVLELTPEWSTVIGDGTTTTTRTNKMLYIPTFAGVPTGVPHVETGKVALGYDTTGSSLYAYNAGWKDVAGPGFVRLPISQATLPTSDPARIDFVSTTGLKRLQFATNETCYFQFTMPQDYGSAPVLRIPYSCSGATAGTATFSVSVWAQTPADALAADTESYDTANVGTDTVPGTLNFPDVVLVTLTTNDGMVAGDTVAIRITSTSNALLNDLRVRGDMMLEYAKQ